MLLSLRHLGLVTTVYSSLSANHQRGEFFHVDSPVAEGILQYRSHLPPSRCTELAGIRSYSSDAVRCSSPALRGLRGRGRPSGAARLLDTSAQNRYKLACNHVQLGTGWHGDNAEEADSSPIYSPRVPGGVGRHKSLRNLMSSTC